MTFKTQLVLVGGLGAIMLFNLASSCGDDGGGASPVTITCNGSSIELGANCQTTYQAVIDCCADEELATQTATDLVCGMQADEDACEQGGATAADAQCAMLAMYPECEEGASDTDADADTDADTDTDADGDAPCVYTQIGLMTGQTNGRFIMTNDDDSCFIEIGLGNVDYGTSTVTELVAAGDELPIVMALTEAGKARVAWPCEENPAGCVSTNGGTLTITVQELTAEDLTTGVATDPHPSIGKRVAGQVSGATDLGTGATVDFSFDVTSNMINPNILDGK